MRIENNFLERFPLQYLTILKFLTIEYHFKVEKILIIYLNFPNKIWLTKIFQKQTKMNNQAKDNW